MSSPIDRDALLAMEVREPAHGQRVTAFLVRRPYDASASLVLVDSEQIRAAKAMTSPADASGSSDSVIERAVRTASYTSMAARPSASRPFLCKISSRASNASRPSLVVVMGLVAAAAAGWLFGRSS